MVMSQNVIGYEVFMIYLWVRGGGAIWSKWRHGCHIFINL